MFAMLAACNVAPSGKDVALVKRADLIVTVEVTGELEAVDSTDVMPPSLGDDDKTMLASSLGNDDFDFAKTEALPPGTYSGFEDATGELPALGSTDVDLDLDDLTEALWRCEMGDTVELRPYEGKALKNGEVIAEFTVKSEVLFDEVRAGGRIPLIVGRGLTAKAREALGLPVSTLFRLPVAPADTVAVNVTARPKTDGVPDVATLVVVGARFTVCVSVVEVAVA